MKETGKVSSKPTDMWGGNVTSSLSLPPALGPALSVPRTYCAAAVPWGRHPDGSSEWSSGPHGGVLSAHGQHRVGALERDASPSD